MSDQPYTLKVSIADDGAVTASLSDDGEFYHGRGPYLDGDREAAVRMLGHDLATRMAYRTITPPDPKRIPQELREAVKAGLAHHASTLKDYLQNIANAEAALGVAPTSTDPIRAAAEQALSTLEGACWDDGRDAYGLQEARQVLRNALEVTP